jgi:Amt family ammonium transporter
MFSAANPAGMSFAKRLPPLFGEPNPHLESTMFCLRRITLALGCTLGLAWLTAAPLSAQEAAPAAPTAEAAAPAAAEAAPTPELNTGDTAWVLTSSSLVLLMTPGLAFFYGGLVRRKNILSVLMQCFMAMCLVTLVWAVVGYSLAFGTDIGGWIGGLDYLFLRGMETPSALAPTIPHAVFMGFQMKFAIITPALVIGAFAERMKFSAFCLFTVIWSLAVYSPVCHWVWGGGFMGSDGALDFAGGTVVHINAGMAALAAALVLGPRRGKLSPPHSLPLAILGAGMLWFGWFGFNAGSALGANGIAANAFVTTHVATASAGLAWSLMDWLIHKKPTTLGMITGAVAGLVAITPAAGFVSPMSAIWIGLASAVVCWFMVSVVKTKLGYDDTLDAFGVHGVGGIVGALLTGVFASAAVNPLVSKPVGEQFIVQLKSVVITMVFSFVASWVIFKLIDLLVGLRVNEHEERVGLDLTQHKESAYTVLD